ncbi:MAG: GNAT family N-acetyltransferase [Gammaproteobacteria bacterium]|nr:GNAT family N-acetyltransferase [Gammaproteobacteria bacterium]
MTASVSEVGFRIRHLQRLETAQVEELSGLLIDCVAGGASVSFMHPLSLEKATAFWQRVAERVGQGHTALLVGEDEDGIAGSVQLILDLPENQPHRADVAKLLVHRRARRRGLGGALIEAAERLACDRGRRLLVLDTVPGSDAERLYTRLGWQRCGVIPDYALMPDGTPCATAYFYRQLAPIAG